MKKYRLHVVLLSVFITTIALIFYFDNKKVDKLYIEYPFLQKKNEVCGFVSNQFLPANYRARSSSRFVALNDTLKFFLCIEGSEGSVSLDNTISIGSKVVKKSGQDSITIINYSGSDSSCFKFKLIFP